MTSGLARPAGMLAAALALAAAAGAHVVYGGASLSALTAGADVVARARILDPAEGVAGEDGQRRPAVAAELLEVLKGDLAPGRVRFAQHGHGVAVYEAGEEVLVFLRRLERSRELAALAQTTDLRWVSLQEHDDKLALGAGSQAVVAAVRRYVAVEALPAGDERVAALAELTFELLRSPHERLAASALGDLVTRGAAPLTPASLPRIEPLLDDPAVAIGVRLGVLAELDRLGLVDGEQRWAALLRRARGGERLAVIRAAGAHPSPAVREELARLLAAGEPGVAPAAAIALGVRGDRQAVAPLARALAAGDRDTQMAAIRALGAIACPQALAALERAATEHPAAEVRRRAGAEVRRLGGGLDPP